MWKTVARNPKYEVSDSGEVRTKLTGRVKAVKIDRYGYPTVCLSDGSKRSYPTVHRLVAEAFIPNPEGLPQVNHKDENKQNNRAENLEWCTAMYNSHYGTGRERSDKGRCRPIIAKRGGEELRFTSTVEASRSLGVSRSTIRGALKGRQHTSCGYEWRYAERG